MNIRFRVLQAADVAGHKYQPIAINLYVPCKIPELKL
jgi:hypothetical protein